MEGLKNMMEDNVERTLDKLLPTMPHICSCNDCRLDMATYALNRLPPKYGRTNTGAILHRFDTSSAQAEAEILTVVLSAIELIGSHPHHAPLNQESSEDIPTEDNVTEDDTTKK
ncbi:MAG: late competence development ComFB family protein [Lachnospiraceae bacterium]|nr:late competence development ComFB family protein [Lachnospiraceae bacterium]